MTLSVYLNADEYQDLYLLKEVYKITSNSGLIRHVIKQARQKADQEGKSWWKMTDEELRKEGWKE